MVFSVTHTLTELGTESDYLRGSGGANVPTPFFTGPRPCETILNLPEPWSRPQLWHPWREKNPDGS
jgi:hypothetical protein